MDIAILARFFFSVGANHPTSAGMCTFLYLPCISAAAPSPWQRKIITKVYTSSVTSKKLQGFSWCETQGGSDWVCPGGAVISLNE